MAGERERLLSARPEPDSVGVGGGLFFLLFLGAGDELLDLEHDPIPRLVVANRQPTGPPLRNERLLELHLGFAGSLGGLTPTSRDEIDERRGEQLDLLLLDEERDELIAEPALQVEHALPRWADGAGGDAVDGVEVDQHRSILSPPPANAAASPGCGRDRVVEGAAVVDLQDPRGAIAEGERGHRSRRHLEPLIQIERKSRVVREGQPDRIAVAHHGGDLPRVPIREMLQRVDLTALRLDERFPVRETNRRGRAIHSLPQLRPPDRGEGPPREVPVVDLNDIVEPSHFEPARIRDDLGSVEAALERRGVQRRERQLREALGDALRLQPPLLGEADALRATVETLPGRVGDSVSHEQDDRHDREDIVRSVIPRSADPADVVVVGDLMLDVAVSSGAIRLGGDVHGDVEVRPGGGGANAAVWAGSRGARVRLYGRVGDDVGGRVLLASLSERGVDAVLAVDGEHRTGAVLVAHGGGERSMVADRGANAHLVPEDLPEKLEAAAVLVSGYLLFHPGSEDAAIAALERGAGSLVAVDAASWPLLEAYGRERFLQITARADLLLANEREAEVLTGASSIDAALALADSYRLVCVKLGSGGAVLVEDGDAIRSEVEPLDVPDPTGAGDALAGVLVAALARGVPAREALREAATTATTAVAAGRRWPAT